MEKFTPGPWVVHAGDTIAKQSPRHLLAKMKEYKKAASDARLMAASPDGYVILKEIREFLDDPCSTGFPPVLAALAAYFKKVEE